MTIHVSGLAVEVTEATLAERLALIEERASLSALLRTLTFAYSGWSRCFRDGIVMRRREIDARLAGTEAQR